MKKLQFHLKKKYFFLSITFFFIVLIFILLIQFHGARNFMFFLGNKYDSVLPCKELMIINSCEVSK